MNNAILEANEVFMDLNSWQNMLNSQQEVFSTMLLGASIGILPKAEFNSAEGKMMAWTAQYGGMLVTHQLFTGFRDVKVDLLFVADDEALEALYKTSDNEALNQMKEMIRRGNILFYSIKRKNELLDLGFEDFLETLGLGFLGPCR